MRRPQAPDAALVFFPVSDLAATRDFYQRDLRLHLVRDQERCIIFRVAAGGYLGFCRQEEPYARSEGVILTLVCPDVDAWYHHLRELGVETEAPPKVNPFFRIYHFFARDPDGYRVEIQRFLEPLP